MEFQNWNVGLFKYVLLFQWRNIKHDIIKEIIKIEHGLDIHLREVMLKLHKYLMKIHFHHNLHCQRN